MAIDQVRKRFPKGVPLLDPEDLMISGDEKFTKLMTKIEILQRSTTEGTKLLDEKSVKLYHAKYSLFEKLTVKRVALRQARSIMQMEELGCRKRVLRRLGYIKEDGVIEMKGRVACEISTGDELLLSELIFHGVFQELTVDQCVALLSCFVFQEKSKDTSNVRLKDELALPLRLMQESAKRIATVSIECKLTMDLEEYVGSFQPTLMDVVFAWCQGKPFVDICQMTDVFEGSIIRCLRRLEELLRQLCHAAKSIGNIELENKFAEGINKIKRDIVFANSLYL